MLLNPRAFAYRRNSQIHHFARPLLLVALCLVAALVTWAGSDAWKSKPFQQWDAKDVQKILGDSPWAKVVRVDASWKTASAPGGADDNVGGAPHPTQQTPGMGGNGGSAPSQPQQSSPSSPQAAPQAAFLIRWVSSRTIREAALRNAVLNGQMSEPDAEKKLAPATDTYQIEVVGPDMTPFLSADEKQLADDAFLSDKKSKQKVAPTKVQIQRTQDGKSIQFVLFEFPKKSANGESTVAADEKTVDFTCNIAHTKIQTNFDLGKMDDSHGRDL
jgi:hypothetical protein